MSERLSKKLGYKAENLVGSNLKKIISPSMHEKLRLFLAEDYVKEIGERKFMAVSKANKEVPINGKFTNLGYEGGLFRLGTAG